MDLDRVAGVYTSLTRNADVSGTATNNRCLLIGLMLPGGLATPNVPFLAQSGAQVAAQLGPGTTGYSAHLYRLWKAALAQRPSAEFWLLPLSDPAGTKSTRLITFAAQPTWDSTNGRWKLGTATGAAQATTGYIDVAGQVVRFQVAAGDLWAAIGVTALAELQKVTDLVVTPSGGAATITLTDVHAALLGEDTPIRVWFDNPNCGIAVQHGTLTLATNSTGGGSLSISDGILSASIVPGAGATPETNASLFAIAVTNANLPVYGAVADPLTGVVYLFHRHDRWVRRFTVTETDATMTATAAWGTTGAGTPSLTAALTANTSDKAYKAWCCPFADTTSLGALATQLIAQDKTPVEKGQMAFTAISTALPASALPAATTPALTTTDLFCVLHVQGATVRAGEMAARTAAEVAGENDHGRNYNGLIFEGSSEMPLSVPNQADASTRAQWNAAIAAGYAPVAVSNGNQYYVTNACTTFAAGNNPVLLKLTKWSGVLIPIYERADLRQRLARAFMPPGDGKSIKAKGVPHTARGITVQGVKSEVLAAIKDWDRLDYYDYAPDIDSAIRPIVQQSPLVIVVSVPFRMVADLDVLGIDAYPA